MVLLFLVGPFGKTLAFPLSARLLLLYVYSEVENPTHEDETMAARSHEPILPIHPVSVSICICLNLNLGWLLLQKSPKRNERAKCRRLQTAERRFKIKSAIQYSTVLSYYPIQSYPIYGVLQLSAS